MIIFYNKVFFLKLLVILCTILFISSCGEPIYFLLNDDLNSIEKGMARERFLEEIDDKSITKFEFEHNGKVYILDLYYIAINYVSSGSGDKKLTTYYIIPFCILYMDGKLQNCFNMGEIDIQKDEVTKSVITKIKDNFYSYTDKNKLKTKITY